MKKEMILTKFQRWVLNRICKKLVIQGPFHEKRIIEYYRIIHEAAENHFTEDNKPTLDSFLCDCHTESLGDKGHVHDAFEALKIVREILNQKDVLPTLVGLSPLLDKKISERLKTE